MFEGNGRRSPTYQGNGRRSPTYHHQICLAYNDDRRIYHRLDELSLHQLKQNRKLVNKNISIHSMTCTQIID